MSSEDSGNRRLLPPVYLLAALIVMVGLHVLLPGAQLFGSPFRYIGLPVLALGIALILWAAGLFKKADTTIRPFEVSSTLVRDGPYSWSRNPIYLGMIGGLVGIGVLLGSASPFLVIPVFAVVIDVLFVRAEEAILGRTFGAAYSAYKSQVRRWL